MCLKTENTKLHRKRTVFNETSLDTLAYSCSIDCINVHRCANVRLNILIQIRIFYKQTKSAKASLMIVKILVFRPHLRNFLHENA